jgi:hypothetical protein
MAIIKTIKDCCSPMFLEFMKYQAQQSEKWHMKYPMGPNTPFEKKHLKLEVVKGADNDTQLAGMAMSLLLNIYEKEPKYFHPEILFCGISLKDRHRKDNYHTDHDHDALKGQKIVQQMVEDLHMVGKYFLSYHVIFYCLTLELNTEQTIFYLIRKDLQ